MSSKASSGEVRRYIAKTVNSDGPITQEEIVTKVQTITGEKETEIKSQIETLCNNQFLYAEGSDTLLLNAPDYDAKK